MNETNTAVIARLYVTAGRNTGNADQLHHIDTRTGQSVGSVTLAPLAAGESLTGLEFVGHTLFATITTGPIGGVVAILYARTNDSPKCCKETGVSSHLLKSLTMLAASCTECAHSTGGLRSAASR